MGWEIFVTTKKFSSRTSVQLEQWIEYGKNFKTNVLSNYCSRYSKKRPLSADQHFCLIVWISTLGNGTPCTYIDAEKESQGAWLFFLGCQSPLSPFMHNPLLLFPAIVCPLSFRLGGPNSKVSRIVSSCSV